MIVKDKAALILLIKDHHFVLRVLMVLKLFVNILKCINRKKYLTEIMYILY